MARDEHDNEERPFHLEGGTPIFHKPPSTQETPEEARSREAHEFARNQVHTNSRIAWFNGLLVLATFTSIGVGVWQASLTSNLLQVSQKSYEASNRPYIGVEGFAIAHQLADPTNQRTVNETRRTEKTTGMAFRVTIKNFGTVPGVDFRPTWVIAIGGATGRELKDDAQNSTLFPSQSVFLTGNITDSYYFDAMNGKKALQIDLTIKYRGQGRDYDYCERQQYLPDLNMFENLGPKCGQTWTISKP